jgi:SagB-type dehydrogenase family enzyme
MNNLDTQAGWRYHDGTKHPYGPLMNPYHRFDPASQPWSFKKYLEVESVPLPMGSHPAGVSALGALSNSSPPKGSPSQLDLEALARLLYYSAGITKIIHYPWGEVPFRAAACTGALYHIELYLVCGNLPGLEAGVYHFDPLENSLDVLRKGDFRPVLAQATGQEGAVTHAPATIIYSDVFWRNACKYQAREYRHAFWDSGTILSHSLAMAAVLGLPARVVLGFVDGHVNQLLGLDESKEVTLALLPLGAEVPMPPDRISEPEVLSFRTAPVSRFELDFPPIWEMHLASSLDDADQVVAWRSSPSPPAPEAPASLIPLADLQADGLGLDPLEEVIIRRGSSRRFARQPISIQHLSTILSSSTGGYPADYQPDGGGGLAQTIYLIVNSVDGLAPGAYAFHQDTPGFERLKDGDFRAAAGHLGLDQALPADAAVDIYFLADLHQLFGAFGNRGYRLAQLEASIAAGKIYLAAYALGLGATGLTFYDDEVVDFFSPHAKGQSVMFLIALGRPARKSR